MNHYVFLPVRHRFTRVGRCPLCGKTTRRSTTIEHTINPFNRNADGTQKTPSEVIQDVFDEGEAWNPDFTHAKCKERSDDEHFIIDCKEGKTND